MSTPALPATAVDGPNTSPVATFADIIRTRVGDEHTALLFENQSWTWQQVLDEAAVRSALLADLVPSPGERQAHVGVLLDNVPDFIFWITAAGLSGACIVGINSSRSATEIADDVRHADVDLIITEPRWRHLVTEPAHGVPAARVLDIDSADYAAALDARRGAPLPETTVRPSDLAFLMYSSGSTGRPKAVILSQGRVATLMTALVARVRMRRDSTAYLCMPLFHGNAVLLNLVPAMVCGARIGLVRRFSASRFAGDVHRFGATFVNYVGRALSYVLAQPEEPRDQTCTLELAFGTEASEADVARFSERFGCEVMEGYGLSEGVFRVNRTADTPPGSLGLPANGADVRILDEGTGEECPRAEFDADGRLTDPAAVGQMVAIGMAHTFEGYYKNPTAMAERVRGQDFWSGDLAYRDMAGWFWFAGRSSDWLRVDSENFAATQVERILQRAPGIAAAPVFAVPDPTTGDRVMTCVEVENAETFDVAGFGAFLAEQPDLGVKWWPTFIRVSASLPLTGSGKVDKTPLRRAAWITSDPVWTRVGRTSEYRLLTEADRVALEQEFIAHGRAAHLPAS